MNRRCLMTALLATILLHGAYAKDSMFDEHTYHPLVSDEKAFKVGDALTVVILETSNATTSVDSKAKRDTSVGIHGSLVGKAQKGADADAQSDSNGGGQTQRSGQVTAQITVNVKAVTESGDLQIAGEQVVEVNGERQVIAVEGRVRPRDVSDTNSVLSSRIADAHITYTGQGYLANKSKPGLFSRVFDFLGL